jgi:septal ring factor EnvC (AmiA/AmiB activator)
LRARAALLVALFALAAGPAPAQEGDPAEIAAREAELERIRDEIAALTARLGAARERAAGLEGDLERLAVELSLQERKLAEAVSAHALAADRVLRSEAAIAELEARLDVERARLERRVSGLYRLGRHGTLRLAFALEPGEDPVAALRLLRFLARRDAAAVERVEDLRARLAVERGELESERAQAAAWLAQQASRRDELAALERRKSRLLAGARDEGTRLALEAEELNLRAERLSSLLDVLYGRAPEALEGRPIQEFRGVLAWPARGRVTSGFGPRADPRYGTRVPHNGVELATVPGEEVRVVYPGKVVFAAEFEGYGPTVVVQHAGRSFTLYAGLERVEVARDDLVQLRAVLGRAGASLYFEIRVDNRPEDPARWIR